MLTVEGLCYLTAEEAGIGGRIKQWPEDFVVEEIPSREPAGRGDQLYLFIEKRRCLTTDVVRALARQFRISWRRIGYAGLKDKHAITRQWFSIDRGDEELVDRFEHSHIRILDVNRDSVRLKRGHLDGNRFCLKIRDVNIGDVPRVRRLLEHLARHGAPNFIGEQRFGYKRNNHLLGRALILGQFQKFLDLMLGGPEPDEAPANRQAREAYEAGDYVKALQIWPKVHRFERQAIGPLSRGAPPEDAVHGIDSPHLYLLVSAFQSAIFNALLNERITRGQFDRLVARDLACVHGGRELIEIDDPASQQPRCDSLEISATGPMWGSQMKRARGQVGEEEQAALAAAGVSEADLERGAYPPVGSRRPFRTLVHDPQVSAGADDHGPYIHCGFELERGSFATIVLREIMKSDAAMHAMERE